VGPPRSYTAGRVRPVQYVVIHATDGSEGTSSAEAGAAYDKIRTDGTSTHLFVDADTALREVHDTDRAHHARHHGNEIGIGVELCGRASQTADQWHDAASSATLRLAANEVAALCQAHGLPVVRLSVAQVRAAYYAAEGQRPKGICGHYDVTRAYPEDNGTHTDPGANFPWSEFLAMVAEALEGNDMSGTADLTPDEQLELVACTIDTGKRGPGRSDTADGKPLSWLVGAVGDIQASLKRIEEALAAGAGTQPPAAQVSVSGTLNLTPAAPPQD